MRTPSHKPLGSDLDEGRVGRSLRGAHDVPSQLSINLDGWNWRITWVFGRSLQARRVNGPSDKIHVIV